MNVELGAVLGVGLGVGVPFPGFAGFTGPAGIPPFVLHAVNPAAAKPAAKTSAYSVLITSYHPS